MLGQNYYSLSAWQPIFINSIYYTLQSDIEFFSLENSNLLKGNYFVGGVKIRLQIYSKLA